MREAAKMKGESTFCNASIDGLECSEWVKGGGAEGQPALGPLTLQNSP